MHVSQKKMTFTVISVRLLNILKFDASLLKHGSIDRHSRKEGI